MHFDRFIEQLGRLAEGEGLPRTAGRMMGVLMIAGAPRSIADLAARLKVSRASISTNSRLLQSLAIADLISEPGSRRDYLQISGDPCGSLLTLGLGRMQSMCTAVRQMRLAMNGAHLGAPRTRLKRIERLYVLAITRAPRECAGVTRYRFSPRSHAFRMTMARASSRPSGRISSTKVALTLVADCERGSAATNAY